MYRSGRRKDRRTQRLSRSNLTTHGEEEESASSEALQSSQQQASRTSLDKSASVMDANQSVMFPCDSFLPQQQLASSQAASHPDETAVVPAPAPLPPPPPPPPQVEVIPQRPPSAVCAPFEINVAVYMWLRDHLSFHHIVPLTNNAPSPSKKNSRANVMDRLALMVTPIGGEELLRGELVKVLMTHYLPHNMAQSATQSYNKRNQRLESIRKHNAAFLTAKEREAARRRPGIPLGGQPQDGSEDAIRRTTNEERAEVWHEVERICAKLEMPPVSMPSAAIWECKDTAALVTFLSAAYCHLHQRDVGLRVSHKLLASSPPISTTAELMKRQQPLVTSHSPPPPASPAAKQRAGVGLASEV